MNYIIVIEGPDNIGKSVLAQYLQKELSLSAQIVHFGPNKTKNEGKRVFLSTIDTIRNTKKNYIFDRSPFGEFIYGKLFRDYDPYTYWDKVLLSLKQLDCRFLFIVLYADRLTYSKFKVQQKDNEKKAYQKKELAEKISLEFIKFVNLLRPVKNMTRLVLNCNNYESLDARNEYILDHVSHFIQNMLKRTGFIDSYSNTIFSPANNKLTGSSFAAVPFKCNSYVNKSCKLGKQHRTSLYGSEFDEPSFGCGNVIDPKLVFVGEAPGRKGCGTYGVPFYGDVSGDLFNDALRYCNILPSEIYITNIIRCCPEKNDLGIYYNTQMRVRLECVKKLRKEIDFGTPIIALGRTASKTLEEIGIRHTMIYHPAYYLRIGKPLSFFNEMLKITGNY